MHDHEVCSRWSGTNSGATLSWRYDLVGSAGHRRVNQTNCSRRKRRLDDATVMDAATLCSVDLLRLSLVNDIPQKHKETNRSASDQGDGATPNYRQQIARDCVSSPCMSARISSPMNRDPRLTCLIKRLCARLGEFWVALFHEGQSGDEGSRRSKGWGYLSADGVPSDRERHPQT
jgi:hypothetical protein